MKRTIEEKLEIMKAYLEGKTIQLDNGNEWEDIKNPSWAWEYCDYRVKPDEPKKLMTCRQLAELLAKGYGQTTYFYSDGTARLVGSSFEYEKDNEEDSISVMRKIRPWGSDEWLEPTVDIYEEYISKWNKAFKEIEVKVVFPKKEEKDTIKDYSDAKGHREIEPSIGERFLYKGKLYECIEGKDCDECFFNEALCEAFNCGDRKDGKEVVFVDVSEMESTTSEESSSTVSKEESVGVHRRTPQEIADFFNCYVAMDKDGMWCLYVEEPTIVTVIKDGWRLKNPRRDSFLFINDALLSKPNPIDWRTLYRPHKEPLVMEEEDD